MQIDLDFVPDTLHLGPNVVLTFFSINILNGKRKIPLGEYCSADILPPSTAQPLHHHISTLCADPGLDCIAGGDLGSALILQEVMLYPSCCYPPTRWRDYLMKLRTDPFNKTIVEQGHNETTVTLLPVLGTTWEQIAKFDVVRDIAYSSPTQSVDVSVAYRVKWYNVTFLCAASTSDVCLSSYPVDSCLSDCNGYALPNTTVPSPPATSLNLMVIWLPILVTTIFAVALAAAGFMWWRSMKPLENGKTARSDPDIEASKNQSGEAEQGNMSTIALQLTSAKDESRQTPPSDEASPTVTMTGSNALQRSLETAGTLSSDHGRNVERRPLQQMDMIPDEKELEATDNASSVDKISLTAMASASALWASGSHADARSAASGSLFNAAAALADITSSQWPSNQDDAARARSERDLQRRVQKIADEMLLTGTQDEKLVLGRMIGRGAFGVVYQGWWRGLEVAVKTILMSHHDPSLQEKAMMEAALASSVVHPNVVSMYHYDLKPMGATATHGTLHGSIEIVDQQHAAVDWKMYLVQELCQTSLAYSLEKFIFHDEATGMPRMDLIVAVLLDVAQGVAHIHSKNILWGDLKPENVLLKMEPSRLHGIIAKISDFGLSTTIDPGKSHVSNYNKGTAGYSAPEVMKSHVATMKSDVFSFGVLMQAMMTRSTPFKKDEGGTLVVDTNFWRPIHGAPPPFMELRRKCLARDPNARPNFAYLVLALQAIYDWGMGFNRLPQGLPPKAQPNAPPCADAPSASNGPGESSNVVQIDPAFMAQYRQQMQANALARAQANIIASNLAQQRQSRRISMNDPPQSPQNLPAPDDQLQAQAP
jgi:serine/threonine protein kinase